MEGRKELKGQEGFTLIEIIAVLIILGILAAVAVPKYLDMSAEAKNKAAAGAVSAAQSAISMEYARQLLEENGDAAQAWTDTKSVMNGKTNCGVNESDFTVTCTNADPMFIEATGKAGTAVESGYANGTLTNPGSVS